ncbi:unnamed protein product [Ambrosiozyma monospora]|uniref:Unnamed protein product n=1 Tax=Ambrosiozyma monospora TaxID=43982 RepID=A0ACB5UC73_AMBMO|nr:unnamed protein product [Ambrosiozyma monospora]
MPTGRLRLPPILIQYSNGNTQNLIIEVGQPLRNRPAQIPAIRINLNGDRTATYRGQVRGQNQQPQATETAPVPAATPAPASNGGDTTSTTTNTTTNTGTNDTNAGQGQRQGVRGIDYPAFDTTMAGVFNPDDTIGAADSDLLNSLIMPIQRALEAHEARRRQQQQAMTTADQTPSTSTNANTNANTTTSSDANGTTPTAAANGSGNQNQTRPAQVDHRNIILTVNYMFGDDANGNNVPGAPNLTGSLVLHVPSIHESNDANVQVLIRLATTIALRTVSVYLQQSKGVSDEDFAKLEIKHIDDLLEADRQCAICYDNYESYSEEAVVESDEYSTNVNGKRKRDEIVEDGTEGPSVKVGKTGENDTPSCHVATSLVVPVYENG